MSSKPPMVTIDIPPRILAILRQSRSIDRASLRAIDLPDGRTAVATGAELIRIADDLVRLTGALEWGGMPTIGRCLRRLQGRQRSDPVQACSPRNLDE